MIKLLKFDYLFRHYDILAKTPSRMKTAITFPRQNYAGSRAITTQYWENLVIVVVLDRLRKFWWKIFVKWYTGIFFGTEQGTGLSCTIYKIPVNFLIRFLSTWSLALVIQTNGTKNFGRFSKNGKKVISRKVLPFFRKISPGMNNSIWILPAISGSSIQMVSAPQSQILKLSLLTQDPWSS